MLDSEKPYREKVCVEDEHGFDGQKLITSLNVCERFVMVG